MCTTDTTEVTTDEYVTQEEVVYVYEYAYYADEAIAYAYEILDAFYYYYGDLAYEVIDLLYAVEDDLDELAEGMAAINETLQEIDDTLEAGLEVAVETIEQLENAAQVVQSKAAEAQAHREGLMETTRLGIENRTTPILDTPPTNIPTDLPSSIMAGF